MSLSFEELDFRPTPMGVLSLRRRRRPMSDVDVYEIKLGDEFLMSSQFTAAEIELARLGLAALTAALNGHSSSAAWRDTVTAAKRDSSTVAESASCGQASVPILKISVSEPPALPFAVWS